MVEFLGAATSLLSGVFGSMKIRERIFFFALVSVLGISSIWIPVQGCSIKHLQRELATTLQENQVLKKEKEVSGLSTQRQKLLLALYQEAQGNKANLEKGGEATKKIRGILGQIEQLQGEKKRIEATQKEQAKKIQGMTPEEQIEYIKRKSKEWKQ